MLEGTVNRVAMDEVLSHANIQSMATPTVNLNLILVIITSMCSITVTFLKQI